MANLATSFLDKSERGHEDDATIRALIGQSIRRSRLSREQIADGLSHALYPHRITIFMLNAWSAPNRESARMPAAFVRAFCEVTQDDTLLRFLLGAQLARLLRLGEMAASVLPGALAAVKSRPLTKPLPELPEELLAAE